MKNLGLPSAMRKTAGACLTIFVCLASAATLSATNYYVDAQRGNDANAGTSQSSPWESLERISGPDFRPGDCILLKAGSRWSGELSLRSSGKDGHPIVIDRYGDGYLPRIDGGGAVENAVRIENVEYVEVRHMEITNHGDQPAVRRGVLIAATNVGTLHHLVVSDLYIHDVNGTNEKKDTGGILFRTTGDKTPSRFDGLTIERNIVWRVDRSGISGQSDQWARTKWFPSLHVVIRDNYAEDLGGDGIVPWATEDVLVEHNVVVRCNQRAATYDAGIWPWSADRSLFRLNEAAYTKGTRDGEGFDSDYNSRGTRFEYNYSHDNDGGFMLICTPVKRDQAENVGNTGTVVRYNISRNDHERTFNLSGADDTLVEHNAIYVNPKDDVQILLVSNWDGWSKRATFRENTFEIAGTGRFGHEVHREEDGRYQIAPGWGGAEGIEFSGNRYSGHVVNTPNDTGAAGGTPKPAALDWNEPTFNPARPQDFGTYLEAHRRWMLRLFKQQFGVAPVLSPVP